MTEKEIRETLDPIANTIRDAGMIPYDQLYGYVVTGNIMYITGRDNARERISGISRDIIRHYLDLIGRPSDVQV